MENPNGERKGPSVAGLKNLFRDMREYVRTHKQKVAPKSYGMATLPRKCCKICIKQFDMAYVPSDTRVEPATCDECQKQLDAGMIACVSDTRFAFIKPKNEKMDDLRGTIVQVSGKTMDEIQRLHKESGK